MFYRALVGMERRREEGLHSGLLMEWRSAGRWSPVTQCLMFELTEVTGSRGREGVLRRIAPGTRDPTRGVQMHQRQSTMHLPVEGPQCVGFQR